MNGTSIRKQAQAQASDAGEKRTGRTVQQNSMRGGYGINQINRFAEIELKIRFSKSESLNEISWD